MTRVITFAWALCVLVCVVQSKEVRRRVLLLSFDGFRWDYVGRFSTPNLDSFAVEGVHAPVGIRAAFVTKTFPDHYTLVTGLYEESHGIVGNQMYDSLFKAYFAIGNNETRWWDGGQPVWTTATLQGLKAGIYFWPGSDVELNGVRPHRWMPYDKKTPFEDRVDTFIDWMVNDKVDLALGYFHEPDGSGHKFGTFSPELGKTVERVDSLLGYIIRKLKEVGMYETTDIIVVSDHGMTNVTADEEHIIELDTLLDWGEDVEAMPDSGALANLLPKPGKLDSVYDKLKNAHPNMTVYRKEDIPDRFHYKNHRRILPLVLTGDEGYFIIKNISARRQPGPGEHGYDNQLQSMRPIFYARGPNFKAGYKVSSSYEAVNVYPLICHLLNIKPAPNNGSLKASFEMLIQEPNLTSQEHSSSLAPPRFVISVLGQILLIVMFFKLL